MRLQQFLAQCGVASRRKAETLITAGHISVNGTVVMELGTKVNPRKDRVAVDGRHVTPEEPIWVVLHKPPGTICSTTDPEGRETVLDIVKEPSARLYPVGRLDYHTSGVLLLTNDGPLAEQILHPRKQISRIYHVKINGLITDKETQPLRDGVTLDDGKHARADVVILGSTAKHAWLQMTLRQGINHQIHRMLETIGRKVLKLIRVEFAGVRADDLRPGKWRHLTQAEITQLRRTAR